MGAEFFFSRREYDYLHDIEVPPEFSYEFGVFMELYRLSGEGGISWESMRAWCELRRARLEQREIDVILKINSWANSEISELEQESEE